MTVDLAYLNWTVTVGILTIFISATSEVLPNTKDVYPLSSNPAGGNVIGGEDDYYRLGFLGSVSPLTQFFFGESQYYPAKVTIIIPAKLPLGDANGDGTFNNQDIASFVLALTNPVAYQTMFPDIDPDVVLDMNGDGEFDNMDIADFVEALTGGDSRSRISKYTQAVRFIPCRLFCCRWTILVPTIGTAGQGM